MIRAPRYDLAVRFTMSKKERNDLEGDNNNLDFRVFISIFDGF